MSTVQDGPQIVQCTRNGHCLSIAPEDLQRIGGDLLVRRIMTGSDDEHGYSCRRVYQSLITHPQEWRIPNAGLLPALRRMADERSCILPEHSQVLFAQLPAPELETIYYPSLAQFAYEHPHGLIRVSGAFKEAVLVAELAVAYPEQRIIVLGAKVKPLERLASALNETLPLEEIQAGPIQVVHGRKTVQRNNEDELPRILCATFTEAAELDFATCDIVVLYDACEAVHRHAQTALTQIDARFRLYGIIRADRKLSPYEEGIMRSVFGFDVIDLMRNGRVRRDVQVALRPIDLAKGQNREDDDSYDYSRDYMYNHYRNDQIARCANALAKGYVIANADIAKWRQQHEQGRKSVILLVGRLDHAIALGQRNELKDWKINVPEGCDLFGLSGSIRYRLNRGSLSGALCQIVHIDVAKQFPGYLADVVICAGGGPGADAVPDSWLFQREGEDRPLLIVDFADTFNHRVCDMSKKRQKAYLERDIFPVGSDPAQARITRFLAKHRPEASHG